MRFLYGILARLIFKRAKDKDKKYIVEKNCYSVGIRGYITFIITMYLLVVASNNKERESYLRDVIDDLLEPSWIPVKVYKFKNYE